MDWAQYLATANKEIAALRMEIPETAAGFSELAKAATKADSLDVKTKELIALALGIQAHCTDCIGFHAKAAVRHGATRDEVTEMIGMCIYMGGGPALMYGAKALAAFDAFADGQQ